MSKELKIVISFFIISFLLISLFSFLNWYQKKDELKELNHIGHPDWSEPVKLASDIYNYNFSLISGDDYFTFFYLTRNSKNKHETLFLKKVNFKGNTINTKKLLQRKSLNDFEVYKENDLIHLYAILGDDDSKQKLKYFQINKKLNIIDKFEVKDGLDYAYGLDLDKRGEDTYIAYNSMLKNNYKIKLVKYDYRENKLLQEKQLMNYKDARLPYIKIYNDMVHLAFLKLNPQKNYQIGSSSKINKYDLLLERYNLNLDNKIIAKKLDSAFLKDERSQPKINIINNNELTVFYHKFQDLKKEILMNQVKYNIKNDKISNKKALGKNIVNIDILNDNNQNKIVYTSQSKRRSILYITKYNNLNNDLKAQRLFTKKNFSYNPKLSRIKNNEYLSWVEMENGKNNIYYANTLNPKEPGFLEIIGLDFEENKMNYITAPLYFISMPILSIFRNLYILAIAVLVLGLLYYLNFKFENNLLKIINKNIYVSFAVGVISIILFILIFLKFSVLFYPGTPPDNMIILTLFASFVGVLFMLRFFRTNSSQAILVGLAASALWIYWCSQISMLFHAYKYFY